MCEAAFQYLKDQLMNPDLLNYSDFSKPFVSHSYASDFAKCYVLSQVENKKLLPIHFGSRVLTIAEKRYAPTEKELPAIYYSVKKEQVHLKGNEFIVHT